MFYENVCASFLLRNDVEIFERAQRRVMQAKNTMQWPKILITYIDRGNTT